MKIFLLAFLVPLAAAQLLGGKKTIKAQLTDALVDLATRAVNNFFQDKEGENALTRTPVHIISATSQVVSGVLYDYKIRFSNGQNFDVCDVEVLYREWMPEPEGPYKVTISGCTTKSLIGGDDHDLVPHGNSDNGRAGPFEAETEISLEDPQWQDAIGIFADNVNARSNSMFRQIPTSGSATVQVTTNDVVVRFKAIIFSSTSCRNTDQENSGKITQTECPLKPEYGADSLPTCGKISWIGRNEEAVVEITDC